MKENAIICGIGSELGNDKSIKGRAKRKMIGQAMALNFVQIAEASQQNDRLNSFWNTFHCQSNLVIFEGRFYGKYCKNRFCPLCCSIRKAEIINRYYAVLSTWEKPHFLTLTVKAVKKERIEEVMEKMMQGFKRINGKYRKRNQRGKGIALKGIKSLECNFNPVKETYNPHFHLIVESKKVAEVLVDEWLKLWKGNWTNRKAQFFRPVLSLEKDLIETIKYGSKIFTEPDLESKAKSKTNSIVYAGALYNIFNAMEGLRIFDRFGFNLPKESKPKPKGARLVNDFSRWIFLPEYHDWHHSENELILSAYNPPNELKELLEKGIDVIKG